MFQKSSLFNGLLGEIGSLTELDLTATSVLGPGLKELASLKNLQNLKWGRLPSGAGVGDAGLRHIGPLQSLTTLDLSGAGVTDAGLRDIAVLLNLTDLDLSYTYVTGAGLSDLSLLKNLSVLDLSSNKKLKNEGLKGIGALKSLTTLNLSGNLNSVSDADLRYLATLANLASLDLNRTSVSNDGLKYLASLTKLATVDLSNTNVKARLGFKDYSNFSLLTNISELKLHRTQIFDDRNTDSQALQQLQKSLPMCRILIAE